MLEEILSYLDRGFSIIPIPPRKKAPVIKWKEFQSRRATREEATNWFQGHEDLNVAIVTGAISGIVVIDVDGDEGNQTIAQFGGPPSTPTVKTGKGKHYYFKHPGFEIRNKVGFLPGIDIRGDGGYAVAPPSTHENGQQYTWEVGLETPLADLPGWVFQPIDTPIDAEIPIVSPAGELSRDELREIYRIVGELAQASEGTRNDQLNKTAFALGQFVGNGSLPRQSAEEALHSVATGLGLSESEILATIKSGLDAGMKKPRARFGEIVEVLDGLPKRIDRPIRLIEDHAYGVTWLPIARQDDKGKREQIGLVIFRDDGTIYSEAAIPGTEPLSELGLAPHLPVEVPPEKRLSPQGFRRLRAREFSNPSDTFGELVKAIDGFLSFENSLADQKSMCELIACWTMGTYCMEAFDVVGYLWPTGERNSGKTKLLNVVSSVAYLGKTTTAGSSFASIRDDAHYGATLAFDDCDNLNQMDGDKKDLLLAGNTRGVYITLKEKLANGQYVPRNVNSFAPRLFSSISIPDPVLESRTISIPLITSAEQSKTRKSPLRIQDWPCDPRKLIDDLWVISVRHLVRIHECDVKASELSQLVARNHDIFRMPLAIAYWLQNEHGVAGVFDHVSAIANSHQTAKLDAGGYDLLHLVLEAVSDLVTASDQESTCVPTSEIAEAVKAVADREEQDDVVPFSKLNQRVGMLLGRLGFEKNRSHGSKRSWLLTRTQLTKIARARGIRLPTLEDRPEEPEIVLVGREPLRMIEGRVLEPEETILTEDITDEVSDEVSIEGSGLNLE